MPENSSCAHAEMMAILLGQKAVSSYDFSKIGQFTLVTSAKMCVMCMGGVIWSGVCEVISSA
jgi:tRNA(Arg) A34 adenosine deaminase TadA